MEEQNESTVIPPAPLVDSPVDGTPETVPGVEADLGKRIVAALIDTVVAMAVAVAAGLIMNRLSYPAFAAYMLTRDSLPFLDGQSIGKKVMSIRAVSETGKSLSGDWNSGLIRNISMVIPFGSLVELIIMVVNKDKPSGLRRLGDQWGKTKVILVSK